MIPLSDLVSRVRTRAEHSGSTRWTDAAIQKVINDGLECLAESSHFYERYVTIPGQPYRQWFDLRGFTPETPIRIKSIWSSNRNEWLRPVATSDLPWDWEESVGEPQVYFTRGVHWFGLWPKFGSSASGYYRVYFTGVPQKFDYTQAVLRDLPDNHLPALEDYALYEMAVQDRDHKRAMLHYLSYMRREKDLKNFMDRRMVGGPAQGLSYFGPVA